MGLDPWMDEWMDGWLDGWNRGNHDELGILQLMILQCLVAWNSCR
jgi:hypothetical protein